AAVGPAAGHVHDEVMAAALVAPVLEHAADARRHARPAIHRRLRASGGHRGADPIIPARPRGPPRRALTTLPSRLHLYRRAGSDARILLLRNRDNGHWGFAKGRRDAGDAHEVETARREVQEETGYAQLALHPQFRAELSYVVRDPRNPYPKRVVYFLAEA